MLEKMLTCENQRDSAKRGWERRTENGGRNNKIKIKNKVSKMTSL